MACPQWKTAKTKVVPFLAGVDRHSSWTLDFGDHMALQRGSIVWPTDGKTKVFLLPDLVKWKDGKPDVAGASTKIGGYMKALQPEEHGGAKRYKDVAVDTLPPQPTAAGLRPGAAETLCISIPAEMALHNTGHDGTKISSLWDYLDPRVALCIPGSLVLSGWHPFPYGQIGKGPVHATLHPLVDAGVSLVRLDMYIDQLFNMHDASPPMLHVGGHLRPLMHITLAVMIMYYEERFKAKESTTVLAMMRESYVAMAAPTDDVHAVLIEWGGLIRTQFNVDNLHLTERHEHGGSEQVTAAVKGLSQTISRQHAQISHISEVAMASQELVRQQTVAMQAMMVSMQAMQQQMAAMQLQATAGAVAGGATAAGMAGGATAPAGGATPATAPSGGATAAPVLPPLPTLSPAKPPVVTMQKMDAGDDSVSLVYDLAGKNGARFILDCMANAGNVPKMKDDKRDSDAAHVLSMAKAMMSPAERDVLLARPPDRDEAAAQRVAQVVCKLLRQRLAKAYKESGQTVPPSLKEGKDPASFNALLEKSKEISLTVDSQMFAAWRNPAMQSPVGKRGAEAEAAEAAEVMGPRKSPRPLGRHAREVDESLFGSDDEAPGGSQQDAIVLDDGESDSESDRACGVCGANTECDDSD
jgi:hypothetical protein